MITEQQAIVLQLIAESEYHDGEDPVEHETWTEVVMDYYEGTDKAFLGVLVSLSNVGMVRTTRGSGNRTQSGYDGTVAITAKGMEALKEYQAARPAV